MQNYKFEIVAVCVLPNHIHLLLNPEDITESGAIFAPKLLIVTLNLFRVTNVI